LGGLVHRLADGRTGIVHGDLARDDVAALGQLGAKPLLVRVQDLAQHQFGAGVNELDMHAA
jgi:hypothetical protein